MAALNAPQSLGLRASPGQRERAGAAAAAAAGSNTPSLLMGESPLPLQY